MSIFERIAESELVPRTNRLYRLRTRLLLGLVPVIVIVLLVTGYLTYSTSSHFLKEALARNAQIHVRAVGHELEQTIAQCANQLRIAAQQNRSFAQLRDQSAVLIRGRDSGYWYFGFISQTDRSHWLQVAGEDGIYRIEGDRVRHIQPKPLGMLGILSKLKPGEVWISEITRVEIPLPDSQSPNRTVSADVIHFGTPYTSRDGQSPGFLILALDVRALRNILSVYNSAQSPIWSFPRTPDVRFAFFFDRQGWILFQSDDPGRKLLEPGTEMARENYREGMLGKPGLDFAYRPDSIYPSYWEMVGNVDQGRYGVIAVNDPVHPEAQVRDYFLAYTPIQGEGKIMGGVAYVDRSRLALTAGYRHLDTMLLLTLCAIVLISIWVIFLSHIITRPIYRLSEAVNRIRPDRNIDPIDARPSVYEEQQLQQAINAMIAAINVQLAELDRNRRRRRDDRLKEKARLGRPMPGQPLSVEKTGFPEIIGTGPKIDALKSEVFKAAQADADVLIIGETGTGKQLAAEAIHRHSRRSEKAFISVNCGELSESLLLDSLFGHVRGAFTEAKADRKGAFLEADGGTLFLDEIQTASLNVQQALLRALAMRQIKPLGSDRDIEVDVRLVAATNADLRKLIETGRFRADLYYRLKVITIYTPPLRTHRESIPLLIEDCLHRLSRQTGRPPLGISRGAFKKLVQYQWPGNVRELINCITRAAVMTESDVIQAEDVLLDTDEPTAAIPAPAGDGNHRSMPGKKTADAGLNGLGLNSRQLKAYPQILDRRVIRRSDYQQMAGAAISARTANYDLRDLVRKGVLLREGSGPATQYRLAE